MSDVNHLLKAIRSKNYEAIPDLVNDVMREKTAALVTQHQNEAKQDLTTQTPNK